MLVSMEEETKELQESTPEIDVLTEDTIATGLKARLYFTTMTGILSMRLLLN